MIATLLGVKLYQESVNVEAAAATTITIRGMEAGKNAMTTVTPSISKTTRAGTNYDTDKPTLVLYVGPMRMGMPSLQFGSLTNRKIEQVLAQDRWLGHQIRLFKRTTGSSPMRLSWSRQCRAHLHSGTNYEVEQAKCG
eukprot:scaffold1803_cov92-Amphora_coffeaeformis.AAC.72